MLSLILSPLRATTTEATERSMYVNRALGERKQIEGLRMHTLINVVTFAAHLARHLCS